MRRGRPAGSSSGREVQVERPARRDPLVGPETAPLGAARSPAAAMPRHGFGSPNGRVAAGGDADAGRRARSRSATGAGRRRRRRRRGTGRRASATNAGLRHDGEPVRGERGTRSRGTTAACSTRSPRRGADLVPRSEREQQLDARHAVHGDRPAGGAGPAEPPDEHVERGQAGLVEDDLHRARGQPDVERRRAPAPPVTATCSGNPGRRAASASSASSAGSLGRASGR